jgi:Cof subfamily protein (haloacid dehalogenase superfamily)
MRNDKYALFFDIDGTLVSFKTHEIPPSTIFALTQAKANGHKVFIATGRPIQIITNLGAIEHLIDGYITTNGAYCYVGDEVVSCHAIANEDVETMLEDARRYDYSCVVASETQFAVYNPHPDFDEIFIKQLSVEGLDASNMNVDVALSERILQFSPFFDVEHEKKLMQRLTGCISGRWHPAFTDITARGTDKGSALHEMAQFLGLQMNRMVAFGDGGNDLTMIREAGIGIAMGNANDVLKQAADFITTTVDDDGVLNALRHYGVV